MSSSWIRLTSAFCSSSVFDCPALHASALPMSTAAGSATRHDERRIEVIANGLPLWNGFQLAVDPARRSVSS